MTRVSSHLYVDTAAVASSYSSYIKLQNSTSSLVSVESEETCVLALSISTTIEESSVNMSLSINSNRNDASTIFLSFSTYGKGSEDGTIETAPMTERRSIMLSSSAESLQRIDEMDEYRNSARGESKFIINDMLRHSDSFSSVFSTNKSFGDTSTSGTTRPKDKYDEFSTNTWAYCRNHCVKESITPCEDKLCETLDQSERNKRSDNSTRVKTINKENRDEDSYFSIENDDEDQDPIESTNVMSFNNLLRRKLPDCVNKTEVSVDDDLTHILNTSPIIPETDFCTTVAYQVDYVKAHELLETYEVIFCPNKTSIIHRDNLAVMQTSRTELWNRRYQTLCYEVTANGISRTLAECISCDFGVLSEDDEIDMTAFEMFVQYSSDYILTCRTIDGDLETSLDAQALGIVGSLAVFAEGNISGYELSMEILTSLLLRDLKDQHGWNFHFPVAKQLDIQLETAMPITGFIVTQRATNMLSSLVANTSAYVLIMGKRICVEKYSFEIDEFTMIRRCL